MVQRIQNRIGFAAANTIINQTGEKTLESENTLLSAVQHELKKAVVGKDAILEKVLMALLAKGHILIEDIPGVGKTTMALAFSKALSLSHNRMQFTPDVLPSDVIGFNILNKDNIFEYKPGAVFCNLFLADEINRTSSKTQSALLEVMEEGSVTVDAVTRPLPQPFMVIATQNPSGSIGTQMLPESQLDRFMIRLSMGYPSVKDEMQIMKNRQANNPINEVMQIMNSDNILNLQEQVEQIYIHDRIFLYMAQLVAASRNHPMVSLGISPRGTIALASMSRACAYLRGRGYVVPNDIMHVFGDIANHRIQLNSKARIAHVSMEKVIQEIIGQVAAPRIQG